MGLVNVCGVVHPLASWASSGNSPMPESIVIAAHNEDRGYKARPDALLGDTRKASSM